VSTGYLVLNHRPATQLARMVGALRRQQPECRVLVHHDRFRCDLARGDPELQGVDVMTSAHPVVWGGFSLAEAVWIGLRRMVGSWDVDWTVVLSGQDYPVKPLAGFEVALKSLDADAMFEAARVTELAPWQRRDAQYRYLFQYRRQPDGASAVAEWFPAILRRTGRTASDITSYTVNHLQPFFHLYRYPPPMPRRLGWRARRTPFSESAPCWHSSSWMALSRRAAVRLLEFVDGHPDFVEYYRHTAIPDESATATILCNDPELRVRHEPLSVSRWTRSRTGHPEVLRMEDLPFIKSQPQFFARKFDTAVDAAVLDALDDLLERDLAAGGDRRAENG
jgi:hypothetical protein